MVSKVSPEFWRDDAVAALSAEQKLALLWLITNAQTNTIGWCRTSARVFEFETGLSWKIMEGVCKALPRGIRHRMNSNTGEFLLMNYLRWQFTPAEISPKSRLFKHLCNLLLNLDEEFRQLLTDEYPIFRQVLEASSVQILFDKPHASPIDTPYKPHASPIDTPYMGPEQSRAEQSRAEQSNQKGYIPSEEEVLSAARSFAGDMARAIPPGIPDGYALNWLAYRMTPKAGPFPKEWQKDLTLRYRADWVAGRTGPRAGGAGTARAAALPDWQALQRREEARRLWAEHPANPDSTAYVGEDCLTDDLRAEGRALQAIIAGRENSQKEK